jgi:hypothetical protein
MVIRHAHVVNVGDLVGHANGINGNQLSSVRDELIARFQFTGRDKRFTSGNTERMFGGGANRLTRDI